MTFEFKPAQKEQSKLRLAIEAPSGSGKTWTSLLMGTALCKEFGLGGLGVIDTERGSAAKYGGDFEFLTVTLDPPFTPERYIAAINAAERAGLGVLIIDSLSHEWDGQGGILEFVDARGTQLKGNKWAAWADATPRHNALVDAITRADLHIIGTMRSKMETEQQEVNGRKEIVKLGMEAIQRKGFEYEYDVVCAMDVSHKLVVTKTRCRALDGYSEQSPDGGRIAAILHRWLSSGVAPAAQPVLTTPVPTPVESGEPVPQDQVDAIAALGKEAKSGAGITATFLKAHGYTGWGDFLMRGREHALKLQATLETAKEKVTA